MKVYRLHNARSSATRPLAALAAAGPCVFAAAWAAGAALQPGFRPLRDDESALAAIGAAHPWITMTGDLLLGVATLALAAGLAGTLSGRAVRVGCAMLLIAGLAIVVQALAREDCVPAVQSCAGALPGSQAIHDAASGLAFLLLPAAALTLRRPFRREPGLRPLATAGTVSATTGLLLFVAFLALAEGPYAGLTEILALIPPLAWIAITGTHLAHERLSSDRKEEPMTGLTTTARNLLIAAVAFALAVAVWIWSGSIASTERPSATGTSALTASERAYVQGISRLAPPVLEAAFGTTTDLRRQMGTSSLAGTRAPDAPPVNEAAFGTTTELRRQMGTSSLAGTRSPDAGTSPTPRPGTNLQRSQRLAH
jgi:hypothetical membrane protein